MGNLRYSYGTVLGCGFLLHSVVVVAQVPADAKQKIVDAYKIMDATLSKHETETTFKLLAPDFVDITKGKTSKVEEWKKNMAGMVATMDKATFKSKVLSAKGDNKTIIIEVSQILDGKTKPVAPSKAMVIHEDGVCRDTWVNLKSKWKLKKSVAIRMDVTVDGKKQ